MRAGDGDPVDVLSRSGDDDVGRRSEARGGTEVSSGGGESSLPRAVRLERARSHMPNGGNVVITPGSERELSVPQTNCIQASLVHFKEQCR